MLTSLELYDSTTHVGRCNNIACICASTVSPLLVHSCQNLEDTFRCKHYISELSENKQLAKSVVINSTLGATWNCVCKVTVMYKKYSKQGTNIYARYPQIYKVSIDIQDIHIYARYLQICKVSIYMKGIHRYAIYPQICKVSIDMQAIHIYTRTKVYDQGPFIFYCQEF